MRIKSWKILDEEKVELVYKDGSKVFVSKKDFDRAFGCMMNMTKDEVEKEYAIAA